MAGPGRWLATWALAAGGLAVAGAAAASDQVQVSGFVIARVASQATGPFLGDQASAQVQLGVDWSPLPELRAHLHLLGRSDDLGAEDGRWGIPEAYFEGATGGDAGRFRARLGLMFLPTSFENIDALWENVYTVSSSALNTWFGEELRPLGLDLSYGLGGVSVGGTVFRGSDTFGALPPMRGWAMHDHWLVLGERLPVNDRWDTALDETDGRLGWSARLGWRGRTTAVQLTHVDNRSDGQRHGDLFNWRTVFDLVGFETRHGAWTVVGELGWGPTWWYPGGNKRSSDIGAGYLLASRRLESHRLTLRVDAWDDGELRDEALTLAWLWTPPGQLSVGLELATTGDDTRGLAQLRWWFSGD